MRLADRASFLRPKRTRTPEALIPIEQAVPPVEVVSLIALDARQREIVRLPLEQRAGQRVHIRQDSG